MPSSEGEKADKCTEVNVGQTDCANKSGNVTFAWAIL